VDALSPAFFLQRGIKQVSGIVAGKGTAGLVGPMESRSQTEYEQARLEDAEGRHRRVVIAGEARLVVGAKACQPRAERAVGGRGRPGCLAHASWKPFRPCRQSGSSWRSSS